MSLNNIKQLSGVGILPFGSTNRALQHKLFTYQRGISFHEPSHTYYYKARTLTSVTTAVSGCFPRFDRDGSIAAKCAERDGVSVPEIRKKWRRAGELGTLVHNALEAGLWGFSIAVPEFVQSEEEVWFSNRIEHANSFLANELNLKDVLYSELTVYNGKYSVAGTVDLVVFNIETGKLDLYDWKTNANIMSPGVTFGKTGFGRLSALPDINYYHYTLQLSIYRWILEQAGFEVGALNLVHLKDKAYEVIPVTYMADEALAVLENSL